MNLFMDKEELESLKKIQKENLNIEIKIYGDN